MTQHTPGPWRHIGCDVFDGDDSPIAHIDPQEEQPSQTVEANARLIAAAPELLAALKALLAPGIGTYADAEGFAELLRSDDDDTKAAIDAARAALAKATGA